MMIIHFKPAVPSDLPILMAYMKAFHEFDHTEPFDRIPAQAAMKMVMTDKNIGRVWLIQQDKEIVGYIVLTLAYRLEYRGYYAFLDELYIRENWRRQGIGTQAMQFLQQACQQIDVNVLHLEVKQDNSSAAALYEKVGFERQNRQVLTQTNQVP